MGRNHAVYGSAVWLIGYPFLPWNNVASSLTSPDSGVVLESLTTLTASTLIAGGAAVVADLDHPDARASRKFGFLSKVAAKGLSSAAGGHRAGTHSIGFAALLAAIGGLAWAMWAAVERSWLPHWGFSWDWLRHGGVGLAAAYVCFCATVGLALIGPSLNLRIPAIIDFVVGGVCAWWVWTTPENFMPYFWLMASGGIVVHCLCDIVTKGGVPFFRPFTKRRFALGIFRVGGSGEVIAGGLGVLLFLWGVVALFWQHAGVI